MPIRSKLYRGVFRAIIPAADSGSVDHQAWFEDAQNHRWRTAQRLTDQLVKGDISAEQWADAFDHLLLEGHANAWWIGRNLGGDVSGFSDADIIAGRAYKDAEADWLIGFLEDVKNGRYLGEDGVLRADLINFRARLYVQKFRGTANDAFVDASPDRAEFYWRLGGNEEHCSSCPNLAAMSEETPFLKEDLPTTPGAGGTECLTQCLCHLERVVNGESVVGIKPVTLELITNESSIAA